MWIHPHIFPWLLPLIQTSLSGSIWWEEEKWIWKWINIIMRGFTLWVDLTVRDVCWNKIYGCCRLIFGVIWNYHFRSTVSVTVERYVSVVHPRHWLVSFWIIKHEVWRESWIIEKIISPDSCQLFWDCHINLKHCQRHNGPKGWVHITSSNTNLDQISS